MTFLLAALWLAAAALAAAQQQDNVIRVEPSGVEVAPDGSFEVAVILDPPEESVAVWVVDVAYDPDVLNTTSQDCDPIDTPGGAVGAFQCIVADDDDDGTDDTVKILGAVLFSGTGTGLIKESTLADITFEAVGGPGDCSDLTLRIRSIVDSDGNDTETLVQDGRACIEGDAPPSGTASPVPFTPRTSEPTPPGETAQTPPPGDGNGQTGQETPETGEPGQTGATDGTGGQTGPTGGTGASARTTTPGNVPGGGNGNDDDGGGIGAIVWVIVGLVALGAAGAGAWALVRLRGSAPPGEG